ncbi:MAG: carbon-nitrogen hydrolase family protein [Anaerolineae bacterium]|nr:carbon-nitrogen hydrolase family protein [Anaerolineae bacterium]
MSRNVRISAISLYLPSRIVTVEENLVRAYAAVRQALAEKPDFILLPEFFATLGTDSERYAQTVVECADRWVEINAPFQEMARDANCYIIPCGPLHDGRVVRNAATLIGRNGDVVGHYFKTHLAPGESGIKPGDGYPVFETDRGRVAMMICMDIHYPEIARIYALQGAEILFWPTMSWGPTDRFLTVLLAARAMDNQIYCVHANFAGLPHLPGKPRGRACVVGPDGEIRADTGHRPGIATATVDLDEGYEYWVKGDLKKRLPTLKECMLGLRRPDTYGDLVSQEIPWSRWQVQNPILVDPGNGDATMEPAPDYLLSLGHG